MGSLQVCCIPSLSIIALETEFCWVFTEASLQLRCANGCSAWLPRVSLYALHSRGESNTTRPLVICCDSPNQSAHIKKTLCDHLPDTPWMTSAKLQDPHGYHGLWTGRQSLRQQQLELAAASGSGPREGNAEQCWGCSKVLFVAYSSNNLNVTSEAFSSSVSDKGNFTSNEWRCLLQA